MNADLFATTIVDLPQHSRVSDRVKALYYNDLLKYYNLKLLHKIVLHNDCIDYILDKKSAFVNTVSRYEYIAIMGTDNSVYEIMYDLIRKSVDN